MLHHLQTAFHSHKINSKPPPLLTSMTQSSDEPKRQAYDKAKKLVDEGKFTQAIHQAKENLNNDPPPIWYIRNCILITCAEDDWERAEVRAFSRRLCWIILTRYQNYRCAAEYFWRRTNELGGNDDASTRRRLIDLRGQLDDVAKRQSKDKTSGIRQPPAPAPKPPARKAASRDPPLPPPPARQHHGRRPGTGTFEFRCPQQRDAWVSISQERFNATGLMNRYKYAWVGRVMEVTGVPRQPGPCPRCAARGYTDCLVEANGRSKKCAHCKLDSQKCE